MNYRVQSIKSLSGNEIPIEKAAVGGLMTSSLETIITDPAILSLQAYFENKGFLKNGYL